MSTTRVNNSDFEEAFKILEEEMLIFVMQDEAEQDRLEKFVRHTSTKPNNAEPFLLIRTDLDENFIVAASPSLGPRQLGLYAARDFKDGELMLSYLGDTLFGPDSHENIDRKVKSYEGPDDYLFTTDCNELQSIVIDGHQRGTIARFVNHSTTPNLIARYVCDALYFFAIGPIKAGTELHIHYGDKFFNANEEKSFEPMRLGDILNGLCRRKNIILNENELIDVPAIITELKKITCDKTLERKQMNTTRILEEIRERELLQEIKEKQLEAKAKRLVLNPDSTKHDQYIFTLTLAEKRDAKARLIAKLPLKEDNHLGTPLIFDLNKVDDRERLLRHIRRKHQEPCINIDINPSQAFIVAPNGIFNSLFAAESIKSEVEICSFNVAKNVSSLTSKEYTRASNRTISCFIQRSETKEQANVELLIVDGICKVLTKKVILPGERLLAYVDGGRKVHAIEFYNLKDVIKDFNKHQEIFFVKLSDLEDEPIKLHFNPYVLTPEPIEALSQCESASAGPDVSAQITTQAQTLEEYDSDERELIKSIYEDDHSQGAESTNNNNNNTQTSLYDYDDKSDEDRKKFKPGKNHPFHQSAIVKLEPLDESRKRKFSNS